MPLISKQELKYILYASVFSFVYFIYILPKLILGGIENSSPYSQFLFLSIGLYIFYFFVLKSFSLNTRFSLGLAFALILPVLAADLIQPEYHINLISGALEKGATLGAASTDFIAGTFWESLGFSGWIMIPLVYFVTFFMLLLFAALIRKNFVKEIG